MTTNPQTSEVCAYSRWAYLYEVPEGQVWADVCPKHGPRVGSEVVLSYSLADATPPEAAARQ